MILSRPRLLPQERFDLEDLNALLAAGRTDSKLYTQHFLSNLNYVQQGFIVSGIGLKQATVAMLDSALIIPQNTTDFSWFTAEPGAPNIIIPEASFQGGVRNYVEIQLIEENNTKLTRAFWDPQANSGAGAEFNQIVDTITDLAAKFVVLTGGFSGSPDSVPLCIIDCDGANNIKTILDRRPLFNRLVIPSNLDNQYAWGTKIEPPYSLSMTSVTGTFVAGEQIQINTETAKVTTGGTSSIQFNEPTGVNFFPGSTVTGLTSGATGTVDTVLESFVGVDKSILNQKNMIDALMTEIKIMKQTRFWWQTQPITFGGLQNNINSMFVQQKFDSNFFWDGNNFLIRDSSVMSPSLNDILASIRILGDSRDLSMARQDGTGGSVVIPIAEKQVLFVKLPASGNRTYSGVGSADTNYQVVDSSAFVQNDTNYWIAYRENNGIYIRGFGELEAGEDTPIDDPLTPEELAAAIAAALASASQDRNLKLVRGGNWAFDAGSATLSWDADANIQIPGLAEARNRIADGSVLLPNDGDVAYVEVNRSAGSPAALPVQVSQISSLVQTNNTVIIARKIGGGSSILAQQLDDSAGDALTSSPGVSVRLGNPIIVPVGGSNAIQAIIHLNKVGSPAGNITVSLQSDSGGFPDGIPLYTTTVAVSTIPVSPTIGSITLPISAFIPAGTYHLVVESDASYKSSFSIFSDYVSVKRKSSGASAPNEERFDGTSWTSSPGAALYYDVSQTPAGTGLVIVGSHSFQLIDGESKTLDAGLSNQTLQLLGGSTTPITEATSDIEMTTRGGKTRFATATNVLDAVAQITAELDKLFGQLELLPEAVPSSKLVVQNPDAAMLRGELRSQTIGNQLLSMNGAKINFQTGIVKDFTESTNIGVTFTPLIPAAGRFIWASIGITKGVVNGDNTVGGQIIVNYGASDGASPSAAPKATFQTQTSGGNPITALGQVLLTSSDGLNISPIDFPDIVQLGVGSGGGSGGGSGDIVTLLPKSRAYCYSDGSTQELNCDPPVVDGSQMKITLHFDIATTDFAEVYVDKDFIPLFVNESTTPSTKPWYRIVASNQILINPNRISDSPPVSIEIRTFYSTVPFVPNASLTAGLQLKGRSIIYSDGSGTPYHATVDSTSGKTVVTTDFDIGADDVILVDFAENYIKQFIDPSVTPDLTWSLVDSRNIQFSADISGTVDLIDIRVYQGVSQLDEFGNWDTTLKASLNPIIIQSPDTTRWVLGATNVGELTAETVASGLVVPYRIERDGDSVVCSFEVADDGEITVNDAPSPGVLVDILHVQSPNGAVWKLGITVDDEPYLEDSFGNKFILRNDLGAVLKQINESLTGVVEQTMFYTDPSLLPSPPESVVGTVPTAFCYVPLIDRICQFIYTNGQWRRQLLAEELQSNVPYGIGDLISSMLDQSNMDTLYGAGKVVLADGRSCLGSAYQSLTGRGNVPDARSTVLRAKNNSRSDGFANPNGEKSLGSNQMDMFQDHEHSYQGGDDFIVTVPSSNRVPHSDNPGTNGTTYGAVTGNPGAETAPKTTTVNIFIRIN